MQLSSRKWNKKKEKPNQSATSFAETVAFAASAAEPCRRPKKAKITVKSSPKHDDKGEEGIEKDKW